MLNKISNFPNIALETPGAEAALTDLLGHIAAFKYFQKLENERPEPAFEGSFSLHCECTPRKEEYLHIDHGNFLKFTFKYLDKRSKYLAIFNFKSSWEVLNLVSATKRGDFLTVLPTSHMDDGKLGLPLKMLSNRFSLQTGDVLKFFVTSKPTTFPAIVLPPMGDENFRSNPDQLTKLFRGLVSNFSEFRNDGQ